MIDAWYSQDAGTLGSGAAGNGGGEASGGLPDGELLRLGEDGVGVLAVLDEVDLEARACLPALAGRVHGDVPEAAVNEGAEDLGRGREDLLRIAMPLSPHILYTLSTLFLPG